MFSRRSFFRFGGLSMTSAGLLSRICDQPAQEQQSRLQNMVSGIKPLGPTERASWGAWKPFPSISHSVDGCLPETEIKNTATVQDETCHLALSVPDKSQVPSGLVNSVLIAGTRGEGPDVTATSVKKVYTLGI